ncbi:hypothetical protein [Microseira wollei]|uniref:Glycosyltransferase RgtA/B/C/D-like domain-containing protein n=1 Tax=Microseira wollei NIES-4236 TaxID=2530354 RepID=A0AAV3XA60_9CYAN|nr:hypothetical protein [Microseira wollei]GET37177.1 hypothetical protein MiSe_19300 [Microseira wollei NIES-4236]
MNVSKFNVKEVGEKLAFLLAIIPAILTGILIVKYGVNVLFWDQWPLASIFEKIYAGNLTFQDLISQHNESRKFFPRLLFIGMAYLTGWDVRYEMLVIFILACLVSFNIYRLSLLTVGGSRVKLLLLACLSNLLIFSPIQWENWLWGIQVVVFVPIACLTTCILVAYSNLSLRIKILIGIVLATISTFSYANGLLCWVLVFPAIALAKPKASQELLKQKWLIVAWLVGFISNVVLYFYDYKKPPYHPSFSEGLLHPIKAVNYFLAFLGAPLAQNKLTVATIVGAILIVTFIGLVLYLLKFWHQNNLLHRTTGWLIIAGYTLISAAITTSGRVGFGVKQSLSSRYATFAVYLAITLIYLVAIILEDAEIRKIISRRNLALNRILSSVLTILIFLHVITAGYGIKKMQELQVSHYKGKACLLLINLVKDDDCLKRIWADTNDTKTKVNVLNNMGFFKPKLLKSNKIEKSEGNQVSGLDYGWLDRIDRVGKDKYRVRGWAVLPEKERPADGVVLSYKNKNGESIAFAVASTDIKRTDVAKSLKNNAYKYSGWEKFIALDKMPKSAEKIKAWAFDAETGKAFELNGSRSIAK